MKNLGKISKENDGFKVVFERILNHPIERVWDAISNPEQLKYWFTDIDFEAIPGSRITFKFRDKDHTESYGEVVSMDPPHRFVWTWEGELGVWELVSKDEFSTKLTFSYSKISGDYAVNVSTGFHDLLDLLVLRLDGSDAIYPFGAEESEPSSVPLKIHYAAQISDSHPEVLKHQPVVVEKEVGASKEKVWKALTEKAQMRHWYFDVDGFDAVEGFQFQFVGQGTKGQDFVHLCTITEVIPEHKLQYSWQYEGFPGYSLVTFFLTETATGTKIKVTHLGLETFPQETQDFARENFVMGWNEIIGKLLPDYLALK
ncbi:SRPBCC family protein [Algoriphagus sp. A40]|uniref:SRPBCC family protein n=1 Tax=Algoriphagus sp. A40 TaxID=1945863 RepID=UPI000987A44A|nr:SRPBCC family protein [Algoriphagus sp. A40]